MLIAHYSQSYFDIRLIIKFYDLQKRLLSFNMLNTGVLHTTIIISPA